MKSCTKCGINKPIDQFNKCKSNIDGLRVDCKSCRSIESKRYREKNADRIRVQQADYYKQNKESLKEYFDSWYANNQDKVVVGRKKYQSENKDSINKKRGEYNAKRKLIDPVFKLRFNIRNRIKNALKTNGFTKHQGTEEILGCSISHAKKHIEDSFTDGMSWGNYGEWHIDHVIPLAIANTEDELIRLCHYSNLQPLWAIDNLKKGSKLEATSQ